jgi:zinc and cadmium transporter
VDALLLLGLYSVGLLLISLVGSRIPERFEMTHTRAQLAMSLVSGLMLGIAMFHLLPHAVLTLGVEDGLNTVMAWVAVGLVTMLLLLRLFHFHQPDFPAVAEHVQEPDHGHRHNYNHDHEQQSHALDTSHLHCESHAPYVDRVVNWRGVLVGLSFHTLVDGVALGAALLGAPHGHAEELLGFGVFLAILLHKPLDAMSISALMRSGGASLFSQRLANVVFALLCPLGAVGFFLYASGDGSAATLIIAAALAFSAGAFICIALSDLLPEVQFHSHDRGKLTAVFLFGIVLSFLLANASSEHDHRVPDAAATLGEAR